jgi:hypothetical protein
MTTLKEIEERLYITEQIIGVQNRINDSTLKALQLLNNMNTVLFIFVLSLFMILVIMIHFIR